MLRRLLMWLGLAKKAKASIAIPCFDFSVPADSQYLPLLIGMGF